MDSIITAAPTDYSKDYSSFHYILNPISHREKTAAGLVHSYCQRATQNRFKQANEAKSLKRQVFQWSSNRLQANPADRLKEVRSTGTAGSKPYSKGLESPTSNAKGTSPNPEKNANPRESVYWCYYVRLYTVFNSILSYFLLLDAKVAKTFDITDWVLI